MDRLLSLEWIQCRNWLVIASVFLLGLAEVTAQAPRSELAGSSEKQELELSNLPTPNNKLLNNGALPQDPPIDSVVPVQFADPIPTPDPSLEQPSSVEFSQYEESSEAILPEEVPPGTFSDEEFYPIDLPTALSLAGANNLQIQLAIERVNEANARLTGARSLWIPSLNGGIVYNNHSGQIQATEGEILDLDRSSLFVGGSAAVGNSPTNAGSGGPARMFVDLSLVDALFEPLAARQLVRASAADRTATFNDTLLQVSTSYMTLVRSQGRVAIAEQAVQNAKELAKITQDFAETGRGLQADADRAEVEAASRKRNALMFEEQVAVASAELARLLRLDQATQLASAEQQPVPLEFVDTSSPLQGLISQAYGSRPEMRRADAERDAASYRQRQEELRPWIPHIYAGASSGGFGGSDSSQIDDFAGRADFDVAALWEVQNLGFGNAALRRERRSQFRQANLSLQRIRDIVAAEVAQAYQRVRLRRQQIEVTKPQVASAQRALRLNLEGIRAGELRPIEIQQAIGALAAAQSQYLDAVIDYNIAQLQLLRSIGQPPSMN